MQSRVGKLLIAHPNLPKDNWFCRTVVYIYNESPQQGTLGVTLNVPTTTPFKRLCYDKGVIYPSENPSVFKGGPVSEQSIVILHTDEWHSKNTIQAGPAYRLSSDEVMFERLSLGDTPVYWRPFLGLTAWAPGQLDAELTGTFPYTAANSWLICDATDDILFNYTGEEQWKAAVELCSHQMINQFF
jgi:putative AlgH/UPF0301 family transcriptional regulator